jgi:glycosyltransferase involved in cell wall biosynthesis
MSLPTVNPPQRILIITNGHLCRNPRPLKEAVALGRAGYDVTVLAVRNHTASEILDRDLLQDAPFRRASVDMLPSLATGGVTVFRRRLLLWVARQAAAKTGLPTIRALGPAGALLRRARQLPADLTIVHNEVPHWIATRLLGAGRRVAADFEDWHSEDLLPAERAHRPLRLLRQMEQTLLTQAVHTTTTSHALAAALQARYGGRRPVVITNSFPLQRDPRSSSPGDPPSFFWFSQTLGPGRGLESLLEAWVRTAGTSRLVLLGEPSSGFDEQVRSRLPPERRKRVSFLPPVPPAALPAVIARHDIGLALEQAEIPSRDLTITNKILQYLNAGLAVVASDTAGQREVLARAPDAGLLVNLSDVAVTAAALDRLLSDRTGLLRRQQAARRLAEEVYCWEQEAPRLLSLVAEAVQTR